MRFDPRALDRRVRSRPRHDVFGEFRGEFPGTYHRTRCREPPIVKGRTVRCLSVVLRRISPPTAVVRSGRITRVAAGRSPDGGRRKAGIVRLMSDYGYTAIETIRNRSQERLFTGLQFQVVNCRRHRRRIIPDIKIISIYNTLVGEIGNRDSAPIRVSHLVSEIGSRSARYNPRDERVQSRLDQTVFPHASSLVEYRPCPPDAREYACISLGISSATVAGNCPPGLHFGW